MPVTSVHTVQVLLQVWSPLRELLLPVCSWAKHATSLGLDIVSIEFPSQSIAVHAMSGLYQPVVAEIIIGLHSCTS